MKIGILLITLLAVNPLLAQQPVSEVAMADLFRSEGKIYVVVAVLLLIFVALAVYLCLLDRKISKLENRSKDYQKQAN